MKSTKVALAKWSRVRYGDIFNQLSVREEIVWFKEDLFVENPTVENREVLQKALTEFKQYIYYKEEYWRQKVVIQWFIEGEKNTRFFHSLVKGRRKKLSVNEIISTDDHWVEGKELVTAKAISFFQGLFT